VQADRDTAAWEAEQLRVRNGELDMQLAASQAEADEQRAAKDDAQAALARARSRIEDLTEEVKPHKQCQQAEIVDAHGIMLASVAQCTCGCTSRLVRHGTAASTHSKGQHEAKACTYPALIHSCIEELATLLRECLSVSASGAQACPPWVIG
jgi:phosphoenolpyruvate-protein kinase (PTS system EI component)